MNRSARGAALAALLVLFALAAPGSSVQAQAGGDRWAAFVGCWQPVGVDDALLCFEPAPGGVEMVNVVDGDVVSRELVVADGTARPVSAEGCEGSESVEFSSDGQRVFTRTELVCEGEERSGAGVMSFVNPNEWVDVRSLAVDGEPVAWAQHYQLATSETLAELGIDDPAAGTPPVVRGMRQRAARDIDVGDVEEAVGRMDARAVEVWVAAQGTPLELSGDELVRLADSGVPEGVIDVMVAVSYPDRFALTPEGAPEEIEQTAEYRGYRTYLFDPYYRSFRWRPYYYSPFGFSPFGFGGYWGYVPATVIVRPVPDDDAPTGRGRMVPGRGYTRRDPQSGQPRPSAGTSAPRRDSPSAGSSRRSGGDSDGRRSGTPTGRTAQPR